MYLLDTDVLSAFRRAHREAEAFQAWAKRQRSELFSVSVITIWEIEQGALRLERRDPAQAAILTDWIVNFVLAGYADRLLDVDLAVARTCARLHVPDPRPYRDCFIAATALAHGLTLVTRNTADFAPMGVPLLNPWDQG